MWPTDLVGMFGSRISYSADFKTPSKLMLLNKPSADIWHESGVSCSILRPFQSMKAWSTADCASFCKLSFRTTRMIQHKIPLVSAIVIDVLISACLVCRSACTATSSSLMLSQCEDFLEDALLGSRSLPLDACRCSARYRTIS